MRSLLILVLSGLVGTHSQCVRAPVEKLPNGCEVGNLTVTVQYQPAEDFTLIRNTTCDKQFTANDPSSFLKHPRSYLLPRYIKFHNPSQNFASSYSLVVFDRTTNQQIWEVSNLTIQSNLTIFINRSSIPPSEVPELMQTLNHNHYRIEYFVFEEHRNQTRLNHVDNGAKTQFALNNSQQNSGITFCRLAAGGTVNIYLSLSQDIDLSWQIAQNQQQHQQQELNNLINSLDQHARNWLLLNTTLGQQKIQQQKCTQNFLNQKQKQQLQYLGNTLDQQRQQLNSFVNIMKEKLKQLKSWQKTLDQQKQQLNSLNISRHQQQSPQLPQDLLTQQKQQLETLQTIRNQQQNLKFFPKILNQQQEQGLQSLLNALIQQQQQLNNCFSKTPEKITQPPPNLRPTKVTKSKVWKG